MNKKRLSHPQHRAREPVRRTLESISRLRANPPLVLSGAAIMLASRGRFCISMAHGYAESHLGVSSHLIAPLRRFVLRVKPIVLNLY